MWCVIGIHHWPIMRGGMVVLLCKPSYSRSQQLRLQDRDWVSCSIPRAWRRPGQFLTLRESRRRRGQVPGLLLSPSAHSILSMGFASNLVPPPHPASRGAHILLQYPRED